MFAGDYSGTNVIDDGMVNVLGEMIRRYKNGEFTNSPLRAQEPPNRGYYQPIVVRLLEPLRRGLTSLAETMHFSPQTRNWQWVIEYAGFMDFNDLDNQFVIQIDEEPALASTGQILVLPNTTANDLAIDIQSKTGYRSVVSFGYEYEAQLQTYNMGMWQLNFNTDGAEPLLTAREVSGSTYSYTLNGSCEVRAYKTNWVPTSNVVVVTDHLEHYPEIVINAGSLVHCVMVPGIGYCPLVPAYRDFVDSDQDLVGA